MSDDAHKRRIDVDLGSVLQTLVLVMISLLGFGARAMYNDVQSLEAKIVALELGLRGDRFTRTDWRIESAPIIAHIAELEARVRELERSKQ